MATSAGVGTWQHPGEEEEEEGREEENEPEGRPSQTRERRAGRRMDRWNISGSSEEMLEDVGRLERLGDDQEEDELGYDLNKTQDLERLGEADPANLLSERVKDDENIESLGSVSHWHPHEGSFEEHEKPEEAWDDSSEGEPHLELSYEGRCLSDFSPSPEPMKDPLALHKHGKPYSFNSEGEEEEFLSENSNLTSSPSGSPPERPCFKTAVVGTRGREGDSQEFVEERGFSSESGTSPKGYGPPSLAGSVQWSCSPLGRLSLEDFQNSPTMDSEAFPGDSWMENLAHPQGNGLKMATSITVQDPQTPAMPKEKHRDASEATEDSRALKKTRDHHPPGRARKPQADVRRGLPARFRRQSRSLSPQRTPFRRKAGELGSSDSIRARRSPLAGSDSVPYGRGQLNYPLPDLSKVEPRVRFPKDPQGYHPPRGKTLPAKSKDSGKPVIFKSPAEIVREVLLSSGEGPLPKYPSAAVSVIPEELKSPRQATELICQLQEDYRKLLTKYAEAENTIDRLRLGAKVRLYADPPKPSHEVQMGAVSHPSKVMTFSIPQIRAAEITGKPGPAPDVAVNPGFSGPQGDSASLLDPEDTGARGEEDVPSPEKPFSGEELTSALAAQASKFRKQVESLEELIRAGRLAPQDQLKGLAQLKGAQEALEQAYLRAREEHRRRRQKDQEPERALGDFDPSRALEGEIFRQGTQLEELKERIEQAARNPPAAWDGFEAASPPAARFPAQDPGGPTGSPAPSPQAPVPDRHTPYPEAALPEGSCHGDQLDLEASSISDEPAEDGEGLPEPLRHMQHQVENDFRHLLDRTIGRYPIFTKYRSFVKLMDLSCPRSIVLAPEHNKDVSQTKPSSIREEQVFCKAYGFHFGRAQELQAEGGLEKLTSGKSYHEAAEGGLLTFPVTLLCSYSSFKSLPGSLSFEQLPSEGRELSPEGVDGSPAEDARRKDVFLRTMLKNKGAQRSPSPVSREPQPRDAPRRLPRKSQRMFYRVNPVPDAQTEVLVSQESAETSRNSVLAPERPPRRQFEHLSPLSSMASIAGSSVSGSIAQKPFRKTNTALPESPLVPSGARAEPSGDAGKSNFKHDLRMVSPETDSGFMGSEASRMSPLAQTPKHHTAPSRSHGTLGKGTAAGAAASMGPRRDVSHAVERPEEEEEEEEEVLPRLTFPAAGLPAQRRAEGRSFHARAPPGWTDGIVSEVEPSGESTHTDSEAEAQDGLRNYAPAPKDLVRPPGPSAALFFSPAQRPCSAFLDSRLERDRAIAALQSEVLQLRQSLEETLCRPHSPPKHPSSPHALRHQMLRQVGAKQRRKTSGSRVTNSEPPSPMPKPEGWTKRASVPSSETQENLAPSESNCSTPKSQKGTRPEICVSRAKSSKQALLRGPYTGARYPFPAPEASETPPVGGLTRCGRCQEISSRLGEGPASKEGRGPWRDSVQTAQRSPRKEGEAKAYLLCQEGGKPSSHVQPASDRGKKPPPAHPSGAPRELSEPLAAQPPGPWKAAPSAPAAALHYLPTAPVVAYPLSSLIYCPLLATTSSASPAGLPTYDARRFQAPELKTWASRPEPSDRRGTLMFGGGLRDLNRSLRRAVDAAKDMKATTQQMSRSLAWELSKAKHLRRSCLF
nr:AT-hook-containing transcription factor [Pogona vitticeps]